MVPHFRTVMVAALSVVVVVVSATAPILTDIFELPHFIYSGVFEGLQSSDSFSHSYGFLCDSTAQMLQFITIRTAPFALFFTYVLFKLWRLLFSPLNYVREVGDVGYIQEGRTKRETANIVQRRRKLGNTPPVYPNGWFIALLSEEVAVKQVKYVSILGENLAVFRGEDGVVYILDAYCPHLGANIAIGGQVKGNCIQCPFHGWRFQGDDGKCVEIPYTKCVPEVARTKAWHALERNQRIYVWYHAENVEPYWFPDEVAEITDGSWTYCGKTLHYINSHIQDMPENGSDVNHLGVLHTPFISCGSDLQNIFNSFWDIGDHEWIASWQPLDGDEKHCSEMSLLQKANIYGHHIPLLNLSVKAKQIGPGIVFMRWKSAIGDGIFIHEVTPVEPMLQKLTQSIFCGGFVPTCVAKFMLYCEALQLERDIMVWNYKTYASNPLLVKEDQAIKKHRKWYQQFYSENSPRLTLTNNNKLDW